MTRWVRRAGWIAAGAIVGALGTWIAITAGWRETRPPLTEGLRGEWAVVSQEFDRRIRSRFPLDSSEAAMTGELRRQGFFRHDWQYQVAPNGEAQAMRREDNLVCNQAAYVQWRADSEGHLTSIRGVYREEGCL